MPVGLSPFVIRFGRLGDTLLLQPLLQKLHLRYGRPCRLLAVGKYASELYAGQAYIESVNILQAHHRPLPLSPQQWLAVRALRRARDCPIYVCEPQLRALLKIRTMLRMAQVPAEHCVFFSDTPCVDEEHWVDHLLRFGDSTPTAFASIYPPIPYDGGAAPQLTVSAQDRADCADWLRRRHLAGYPLILLQPANKRTMRWNGVRRAADDDKSWPISAWASVARALCEIAPQARVVLCGAPAEASYLAAIRRAAAHASVEVAAQDLPVRRLKALLAMAHSMISVDTGPAHLAAAVGCPLVVLFGAASLTQWTPRNACADRVCVLGGAPHATRIDAIAPQQVIDTWQRLALRVAHAANNGEAPASDVAAHGASSQPCAAATATPGHAFHH